MRDFAEQVADLLIDTGVVPRERMAYGAVYVAGDRKHLLGYHFHNGTSPPLDLRIVGQFTHVPGGYQLYFPDRRVNPETSERIYKALEQTSGSPVISRPPTA